MRHKQKVANHDEKSEAEYALMEETDAKRSQNGANRSRGGDRDGKRSRDLREGARSRDLRRANPRRSPSATSSDEGVESLHRNAAKRLRDADDEDGADDGRCSTPARKAWWTPRNSTIPQSASSVEMLVVEPGEMQIEDMEEEEEGEESEEFRRQQAARMSARSRRLRRVLNTMDDEEGSNENNNNNNEEVNKNEFFLDRRRAKTARMKNGKKVFSKQIYDNLRRGQEAILDDEQLDDSLPSGCCQR